MFNILMLEVFFDIVTSIHSKDLNELVFFFFFFLIKCSLQMVEDVRTACERMC